MSDDFDPTEQLVSRFRQGDDEALGGLFDAWHDRLKRIVQFRLDDRLKGRISASDVIQESFISASERTEHFRNDLDMPLFLWLRLIVNQKLADFHRRHIAAGKRDVRREVSFGGSMASPQTSRAMAAQLVGRMTSPSRAFSRVERIAAVEGALNRMEAVDREVIALRHFEELTNVEVAAVLDISVQAASKRYVRAIQRMKELLSEFPGLSGS